jgi:hypothetical protein
MTQAHPRASVRAGSPGRRSGRRRGVQMPDMRRMAVGRGDLPPSSLAFVAAGLDLPVERRGAVTVLDLAELAEPRVDRCPGHVLLV